ncbi:MAG: TlpA family protein disulfide reductase [Desulfovibrionaceae bacterium]
MRAWVVFAWGVLLAAALVAGGAQEGQAGEKTLEELAAPEVESVSHMDVLRAISHSRGKVVVVNFFASWCQPCRQEVPHLKALRKAYAEDELVVLGFSVDDDATAYAAFRGEMGFTYPVALTRSGVSRVFQVQSIPKTLMYAKSGELAMAHDGFLSVDDLRGAVDSLLGRK